MRPYQLKWHNFHMEIITTPYNDGQRAREIVHILDAYIDSIDQSLSVEYIKRHMKAAIRDALTDSYNLPRRSIRMSDPDA